MRSLRRAASTHRIDMLSMTNSESAIEPDILLNSPLVSWLRQELQYAWLREKAIRTEIAKVADRDIARLESHMQTLTKQTPQIRAEVEAWQMRNEELETRLHRMTEKVWSLKMICLEQQKHLKR